MKKFVLAVVATALLGTSAAFAQVYVRVAPPPPIVEHRPLRPGPQYVWLGGYHRWNGRVYVWVPGRWVVPPRPAAVWIPGHWAHSPHGYMWISGHWRYTR
ncbi:MAG TPA: hypothetical protein VME86_05480 [Acidobacteriaceae bacterium]|nr:hypothetical protein [Acidobacteriaceae bacterium]